MLSRVSSARPKLAAAGVCFLGLLLMPSPLLPPHQLAEAVQSVLGLSWKGCYLLAAVALHTLFYGSIGLLAAFASPQASSPRGRSFQLVVVPAVVIAGAVIIRSVKVGHVH